MSPEIVFSSSNDSSSVSVRIYGSSLGEVPGYITLSNGDYLIANLEGVQKELEQNPIEDTIYLANYNFNAENQNLTLSLIRNGNVDAPNSTVVMPARFNINTPNPDDVYMNGEDITVTWSPAITGTTASISIYGLCAGIPPNTFGVDYYYERNVPDNGSFTAPVIDILDVNGEYNTMDTDTNCSARLIVERIKIGSLDSNYRGGSIIAKQIVRLDFFLDP